MTGYAKVSFRGNDGSQGFPFAGMTERRAWWAPLLAYYLDDGRFEQVQTGRRFLFRDNERR